MADEEGLVGKGLLKEGGGLEEVGLGRLDGGLVVDALAGEGREPAVEGLEDVRVGDWDYERTSTAAENVQDIHCWTVAFSSLVAPRRPALLWNEATGNVDRQRCSRSGCDHGAGGRTYCTVHGSVSSWSGSAPDSFRRREENAR